MHKKPYSRAFTLVEIIVSTILLSIGITFLARGMFWSKVKYSQFLDDSFAMNSAYLKMQEFITQSYDTLGTRCSPAPDSCPGGQPCPCEKFSLSAGSAGLLLHQTGVDITHPNVNWNVNVRQDSVRGPNFPNTSIPRVIPFKEVEVIASYIIRDQEGDRSTNIRRQVRLVNIVAYPYMHTNAVRISVPFNTVRVPFPQSGEWINDQDAQNAMRTVISAGGNQNLSLRLRYETRKDLSIFYDIVTHLDNMGEFTEDDTIFTSLWIINEDTGQSRWVPITTRTLTPTQRVINNATAHTFLSSNNSVIIEPNTNYRVEVRWLRAPLSVSGSTGDVFLATGNLIVIADEVKER